ncbi:MAG: MaoC family dehydratase [Rhodobacter sp.]|jgi:acyl dehydratase|nr:MaoC family dehydratase [Rhodobacter sp.]
MAHTVESLRDLTGKRVGTSRWFTITQTMIDAHADIVEDHQFIHVDPEKAARTPFGGTIAHGFLTLSMLSAMAYDAQPEIEGAEWGVNYGLNRLRFVSPVPAGARIRAHFTLNALEQRNPAELTLTWGVEIEIEDNPRPALIAEWINRYYLKATAP